MNVLCWNLKLYFREYAAMFFKLYYVIAALLASMPVLQKKKRGLSLYFFIRILCLYFEVKEKYLLGILNRNVMALNINCTEYVILLSLAPSSIILKIFS